MDFAPVDQIGIRQDREGLLPELIECLVHRNSLLGLRLTIAEFAADRRNYSAIKRGNLGKVSNSGKLMQDARRAGHAATGLHCFGWEGALISQLIRSDAIFWKGSHSGRFGQFMA
jgi:hypothetical protein